MTGSPTALGEAPLDRTAGSFRTGPATSDAALKRVIGRRSVPPRRLTRPGPSEDEVTWIVQAACAAPDHAGLRPFRFVAVGEVGRDRLADAFEAAKRELDPAATAETVERARERALHAPFLLGVITRTFPDHPDVPLVEQLASAGAALGYALLAANLLGYGAMAVSGHKLRTRVLREAFALGVSEDLLCFVAIGTPEQAKPARPTADDLSGLLRSWP